MSASAPPPPPTERHRLLHAQLSAIYAVYPASFAISMAASFLYAGLYYWLQRDPVVLAWLLMRVPSVLIYLRMTRYFKDPDAANRTEHWQRMFLWGYAYHSLFWSVHPWLFTPAGELNVAILNALFLLSLITGGLPGVAHLWPAVLTFVVPINLSLFAALVHQSGNSSLYLFLAVGVLIHLGITLLGARSQNRQLTESLLTRFANQDLSERLQRQVAETERLSAEKTRFFASASHDLRQPMHAIALFGAVLDKKLAGQDSHVHAQRLMGAVHTLGHSLDTLLDVSRLDAGVVQAQPAPVALNTVFQRLHALFAGPAEEQGLQLRIRATGLWVRSDAGLLERLLGNLIDNALKYTPEGGVLVVARSRAGRSWIEVVDTGVGIAPEHAERVFEEFYQINNPNRDRTRGLGIGLSIVRRLARLLDHPVHLRSRPGKGTRFRVEVPVTDERTPAPADATAPPDSPYALPARVLLIDDEADIGAALGAFLSSWGVELTTVTDESAAATALTLAKAQGKRFDTLICDYRLAEGADGLEVALRLRQALDPGLPLLLITGDTAPQRLQRVREAQVPVLFKPVVPQRLLQVLGVLARSD